MATARDLFGGAITADVPARLVDVSDFRPVPNHQEVLADGSSDQSLIVEIVERAEVDDAGCGSFFFDDMASHNEAGSSQLESCVTLGAAEMPGVPEACFKCLVAGRMWAAKGRQGAEASNAVQVLMAIIRLPSVATDLLVTLHTPMFISSASAAAEHAGSGEKQMHLEAPQLMHQVLRSFKIVDWGLFG